MKIHDKIEQGTDEWKRVRAGKLTASSAQAIGTNGKGLETLVYETLAEKYSSSTEDTFSNAHTERGKELEETAIAMYELERGIQVRRVGFIERDAFSGCSPDGLVGENGGVEVKCHSDVKHFGIMVDGLESVDTKHLWQVQMSLLVTGRAWWDLICYNPNFQKSLVIFRILPDEEMQKKLLTGLVAGKKMIQAVEKKLKADG